MKKIRQVWGAPALTAVLFFLASGCGGQSIDPGLLDEGALSGGGGGQGGSQFRSRLATADGEPLRTEGLGFDGEYPFTGWPPRHPINIWFPPAQDTVGDFNANPGEGTVYETKWSQLEKDVVWEINKFRANPVGWCSANGLAALPEGVSAQAEFIQNAAHRNYSFPAQPLYPSRGLHQAALHKCARGDGGHNDVSRVRVYVNVPYWGENVASYSGQPAARIVWGFIADGSEADKGHRVNLSDPQYDRIGVGIYNRRIIIDLGGHGVAEKTPWRP
ncbi:MAG: hypothetical protein LBD31_07090 [Treponema sp.]|nr:hypothetical protein [Treponema sp.]